MRHLFFVKSLYIQTVFPTPILPMTQVELFHQPAIVDGALAEPVEAARPARQEAGPVHPSEDRDTEPRAAYEVCLADYAHGTDEAIGLAQRRFQRELERQLGTDVLPALHAFQNASESSEHELSKADIALARRWAKAYDTARTAGFRDLGDTDEAFFEVRATS